MLVKKNSHKTCLSRAQICNGLVNPNGILPIGSREDVVIYLALHQNWLKGFAESGANLASPTASERGNGSTQRSQHGVHRETAKRFRIRSQ